MFDIGFAELLIIAIVALVVLGPERVPHAVRTTLRWVNYLRRTAGSVRDTMEKELKLDEIKQDLQFDEIKKQVESAKQQVTSVSDDVQKAGAALNRGADSVREGLAVTKTEMQSSKADKATSVQPVQAA